MKDKKRILNWLIDYRSVSQSKEQIKLRTDIQKFYGGNIINGNLVITKGTPNVAIVGHLDINQIKGKAKLKVVNNIWYSENHIGCGFDDKAGICFALDYLNNNDNIQVILTYDEEIGCIGAKQIQLDKEIKFLVQLDRRGFSDISDYTNGVQVINEGQKKIFSNILSKYNYIWTQCVYTDIGEISKNNKVQSVNISCGYYNEHTENEYLDFNQFENACNFATELIEVAKTANIEPLENSVKKYYDSWYDFEEKFNENDVEFDMLNLLDGLTMKEIDTLKLLIKYY